MSPANDATLLVAKVGIDQSVDSFLQLLMLASAFHHIDVLAALCAPEFRALSPRQFRYWPFLHEFFPEEEWFFQHQAQIKSVQISSPPVFVMYCSPEWLAVYVAIFGIVWQNIATYDAFKRNVKEIRADISAAVDRLENVSADIRQLLVKKALAILDGFLELREQELMFILGRLQETRRRLSLVDTTKVPITEVSISGEDAGGTELVDRR